MLKGNSMGNFAVSEVTKVDSLPVVGGRKLSVDELKANYFQIGNIMIQKNLYDSLETENVSGTTYLTINLGDGTSLRQGIFDEFSDGETSFISQEDDGTTIFDNFSSAKIFGTPNDDKYKIKNSFGCEVTPGRGNDSVFLEKSRATNIALYKQLAGETDSVDIDKKSGAYIGYDDGPFGGYKNIKGTVAKDFTGTSVFSYKTK